MSDISEDDGLEQALARANSKKDDRREQVQADSALAPFILMRLRGRWFAAPALEVQRVVVKGRITRVPGRAEHILGLSLVHDTLIPVVDLAALTSTSAPTGKVLTEPRLVVLGRSETFVGVVAEEAYGIEELPEKIEGENRGVIAGEIFWRDRQVFYLNVNALISAGSDSEAP